MRIVEDHRELIVRAARDRGSERGRERERKKEERDTGDEAWYARCSILHLVGAPPTDCPPRGRRPRRPFVRGLFNLAIGASSEGNSRASLFSQTVFSGAGIAGSARPCSILGASLECPRPPPERRETREPTPAGDR